MRGIYQAKGYLEEWIKKRMGGMYESVVSGLIYRIGLDFILK